MIPLLKTVLKSKKHLFLMIATLLAMCAATLSSQLEIFSIGILTKKGSLTSGSESTFFQKGYALFDDIFSFSDDFRMLALLIVVVALIKASTLFFHRLTTRVLSIRISRDLRENYFQHLQTLPLSFFQKYHMGSLSSRVVGDASVISDAINSCLTNYIQTPFTIITTLSLCFWASWQLSLIIFFGFPLIVFPILYLAKRIKRIAKQLQKNQESFASVLLDFLAGVQTIKLFSMEKVSYKKYQEQNEKMAKLEYRAARYDVSSRPIIHTIGMFFLGFALMWGLYVIDLSVSEVLVYCGFLYIFYEPIKKFAEENGNIQKGVAAAERMHDVLKIKPDIIDQKGAVDLNQFNQEITFKNVWFKYSDDWILKNLSLTIRKGEKVAIVGPTGAGKSTITQLIPRLYDIQKGEILIDGKPITSYTQQSLREQIGFVPQKPFLFLDSIADNISFGQPATLETIQLASKRAYADEFIDRLPNKYNTELAESGKNLSGGQQQRLAIARALFKKAPILIMDEATSSLDAVSEDKIKSALHELRGSATQLIIAHRFSTIEDADKIIFIDKGEKIAEGTKDELLTSCPPFKKMWELLRGPDIT
ncbi:ABC transporter ATP-binding protein/permease [Chlamydiales bacterium]|nr:ABC transporter ATP-binding protein/permease [Chlamydiales bacterium]